MITQQRQRRIGGYRAGQRPQDAKYHHTGRFEQEQLPPRVDLRKHMTDVEEQIGNSCVANAFVGAYEYLAKRDLGDSGDVSRLFVYYNARVQMGGDIEDAGTQMYCAIDSLIEHGACSEEIWPNDESLLCEEPSSEAYEHAAYFTITESEFIETDLDLWRHTLAEGYPIVFALNTFESFDGATTNRGRVPLPKQSDNVRETHGWHAMLCVGYSDKDQMFIVRNSWGPEWGDRGYCYIPYRYIIHQDYNAHDSWIIKSVSDLDFSTEWEDEESVFADENSLLLQDFYIRTGDSEGFIEDLDQLCQSYVESEEDYYFDYEEEEDEEAYTVSILNFDLTIEESDEFLEELDSLCQNYAIDEDYNFTIDSESEEGEGEEEESEEEYEEEDSEEEDSEEESEEEEEYEEEDSEEEEEYEEEEYEEE
ncbi:C1 family peptidase [Oculatella sp. FACHB-28]|uniref:C1 family peptidase n=1 Tax=Oculatella sp. FACHB-28 TaxID=2692845 RepID=UPI001688978D|nr:C1 family peptidase [Oculatella sp. FACHB-28]